VSKSEHRLADLLELPFGQRGLVLGSAPIAKASLRTFQVVGGHVILVLVLDRIQFSAETLALRTGG